MSTFIVAEKVVVTTKNNEDEKIIFEITDVFKEFNYLSATPSVTKVTSGTTVRVYLKRGFQLNIALSHIVNYCRHLNNLHIVYDGNVHQTNQSWNIEGTLHTFPLQTEMYEVHLGISVQQRDLIATNSGFLITRNPIPLLPFKFPIIIGGEVNFAPKGIDFDMSRTNIMVSEKSESFRRNISVSLRKLFREALEAGEPTLLRLIVTYLQYYLQNYDNNNTQMQSYTDFYSKKELIVLCSDYTSLNYKGRARSLSEIIGLVTAQSLNIVFYIPNQLVNDYQTILNQYLENKGYLVFKNRGTSVVFRNEVANITLQDVIQTIASTHGLLVMDINQVPEHVIRDMKMDKNEFDGRIKSYIKKIELRYGVNIEIGKFSSLPKASVRNNNQIFLNFDHETFQSLLGKTTLPDQVFETYLLGILGLHLPEN